MKLISTSIKISVLGLVILLFVYAWSNLWVVEQIRSVEEFEELAISGIVEVYLNNSSENHLKVRADKKFIDQIKTEVDSGRLHIYTEGTIRRERIMKVELSYKQLSKLYIGGVSTVICRNVIKSNNLDLEVGGAAEAKLRILSDSLKLNMNGVGNVQMAGAVKTFQLDIKGFGDLVAYNLESENATVRMDTPPQSKGIARIHVIKDLDAEIIGPRFLYFMGDPNISHQKIEGSGKIIKK